jgi:methionine synthase II (cobalamin-independent)
MSRTSAAVALTPGLATGIGSLPYHDAREAAGVSLRCLPELPAAPQLPERTPLEGMIVQWARALPEVAIAPDGSISLDLARRGEPLSVGFDTEAHGGLLAFVELAAEQTVRPERVKLQLTGPLTMGVALIRAGMPSDAAFARAAECATAWVRALDALVARELPDTRSVIFVDEPALVLWSHDGAPLEREAAVDLLSGVLTGSTSTMGVHVCGDGDRRLAFEAGAPVVSLEVRCDLADDAAMIGRHLEADGWIAWGAVPTDRPIGESPEGLWKDLARVWCELTRHGCDPIRLRTQAIVTPACGLAGHGPSQAERALRLARELAGRVHDQSVAARLTLGA